MKNLRPELGAVLPLPSDNPIVTDFLQNRRSNLVKDFIDGPAGTNGPSEAEIAHMLSVASRVPDHRKLAPWRFILWQGEARARFGQEIRKAFEADHPNMPEERAEFEENRFMRAPLVIAVVSSIKDCARGTPKWEQELSSGALCFNLCLAAQSLGFAAQWLTEWYAFDSDVSEAAGLTDSEKIAGYIYIGRTETAPTERPRPILKELVSIWPK